MGYKYLPHRALHPFMSIFSPTAVVTTTLVVVALLLPLLLAIASQLVELAS